MMGSVGFGQKGKTFQPEGTLMTGNGKSGEGDMSDSHDIIPGPGCLGKNLLQSSPDHGKDCDVYSKCSGNDFKQGGGMSKTDNKNLTGG